MYILVCERPTKKVSMDGSSYFGIFIYGFSHKVWVYILKQKSKVFTKFKLWKENIKNQTGRKKSSICGQIMG